MTNSQLTTTPSAVFADSKPHYALLDGLRGAAALMVVWYHFFEGFAFAEGTAITTFCHGHLGVDLFFMLSGFVISYAYDDRWKAPHNRLTMRDFFKRRSATVRILWFPSNPKCPSPRAKCSPSWRKSMQPP